MEGVFSAGVLADRSRDLVPAASPVIFTLPGLNGLGRMASAPTSIADDEDLTAALEWFREIDGARGLLGERVRQAQAFFRSHAVRMDVRWPPLANCC